MQATVWGWSSADDEVARVYSYILGLTAGVEAIGEGMTTVSLSVNGSATGSASVTVTLPTARVNISPASLTFDALEQTKSVTVRVLDENGDEDENASFSYTSTFSPCCSGIEPGNPFETLDIEQVDDGLEITAEGTGTGTIRIRSPGVEPAILLVTVYQVPVTLELSPDSVSLEVGGTATLSARLMDANGHDLPLAVGGQGGKVVYWATGAAEVATVVGADVYNPDRGATATVTAVAAGTATITGTHGYSVSGTATVTVTGGN